MTIIVTSVPSTHPPQFGDDEPAAGYCGRINPFQPCETITQAVENAATYGFTDVLVGEGTYPAFDVTPGINVSGGRNDDGGDGTSWAYSATHTSTVSVDPGKQIHIGSAFEWSVRVCRRLCRT